MAILVGLMIWYHFVPGWTILCLPLFLLLAFVVSVSAGLYVAALNVKYRDFKYIVPFVVQFGLYISPVGFSSSIVHGKWKLLYYLNPMVGIIDGFRWSILGGDNQIYILGLLLSIAVIILILIFSLRYFRKMEKTFADII
jgi:lipopolysaccharide transport system permease protein